MICQNCNNINFYEIIDLGKMPIANTLSFSKNSKSSNFSLKIIFCKTCQLIQTHNKIGKKVIFNKNYPYLSSVSSSLLKESEDLTFDLIKKFNLKQNKSFVVEVGSNDGYLLKNFVKNHINCLGIEPSKIAYQQSKKKKIQTINDFFGKDLSLKIIKKYGQADLIISNNTIAHIPNLHDLFSGFSLLLKEDGIIVFEFQYFIDLIKSNIFDNFYHEHYLYYSLISLRNILASYNLDVFDACHIKAHGGSLRVFVKKKSNYNYKITKRFYLIFNKEQKMNIHKLKILKKFKKTIFTNRIKYLNILRKIRKKNNIIAYGAAAKSTIFLNFCKIKRELVPIILDEAKSKQGKFVPGVNIPIYSHKDVELKKFNYILILAWNLKDEIIKFIKKKYPKFKFTYITFIPKVSFER